MELTEECRRDYLLPTHAASVPSRTTFYFTGTEKQGLDAAPKYVQEVSLAINEINVEHHEHTNTVHGLKDLLLAKNWDVHMLAIKKLVAKESIETKYSQKTCAFSQKTTTSKKTIYCSSMPMGYCA